MSGEQSPAGRGDKDDEVEEALPLLRAVLRECHLLLTTLPDPSILFSDTSHQTGHHSPPEAVTPTEERLHRDWGQDHLDTAVNATEFAPVGNPVGVAA